MSARTEPIVMPGCAPVSDHAETATGALVLHGVTGNPCSIRRVAHTMIAAEFDVELTRLPGHGTTLDSERLAATHGGPIEHTRLRHGHHVAALDNDRETVRAETAAVVASVATS